ncbi:hypothetical protein HA44_04840 [Mixta gaviniae]|nr:hypothetical protein HA44_04840 [Mixta gaviniae]
MAYYPLEHMDLIAPRPVLLIAGEKAETRKFSQQAYDNARQPKELVILPGASHFDLYDKPQFVNPAADRLAAFFRQKPVIKILVAFAKDLSGSIGACFPLCQTADYLI